MTESHAREEYEEIIAFKTKLDSIKSDETNLQLFFFGSVPNQSMFLLLKKCVCPNFFFSVNDCRKVTVSQIIFHPLQ